MHAERYSSLRYNGKDVTQDITKSLTDFQYNDAASGSLDDLTVTLEDRERNWQGPWSPVEGDQLVAAIRTVNWDKPGEIKKLPLGTFEVDSIDFSGPPDTISIKAVSLPVTSEVRMQRRLTQLGENQSENSSCPSSQTREAQINLRGTGQPLL